MLGLLLVSIPLAVVRCACRLAATLLFRRYVFLFVTVPSSAALYRRYRAHLAALAEEERRRALGMDQNGWVSGGAYVPHRTRMGGGDEDDNGGGGDGAASAEVSNGGAAAASSGGLEAMRRRQQERLRQEASSGSATRPAGAGTDLGRPGFTPGIGLRRRKFASPPTSAGRSPVAAASAAAASSAKRRRTDNDGGDDNAGEPLEQLWKRTRQGLDMATTVVSTVFEAGKRKFATADAEE